MSAGNLGVNRCARRSALILAAAVAAAVSSTQAADVFKADNADALNLTTAWSLNVTPTALDYAVWDNRVSVANLAATLGANAAWGGIKILDPAGAVTLNAGNTVTIGGQGIDMSLATQNLTIASGLTLATDSYQTWNVGAGRTLNITGAFSRTVGTTALFTNAGVINISALTASSLQAYGVVNGTDLAAADATKNIVGATTVFTYVNPAGGNQSGTVVGIDVQTTTAGATQAYRHSNALTTTNGVRFNAANTQNTLWTVDTSNAGRVGTLPSILVTANVGAQNVEYNGLGGIRAASSGGELILHQYNPSGDLIFNTTINANGAATLTKDGPGRVIINSASGYTGVTRIQGGVLQVGNGTTAGAISAAAVTNNAILAFNRSDGVTFANNVSGSGRVRMSGSGTLTLSGTNTYTGGVELNNGVTVLNALGNFGNGGPVVFGGGSLQYGSGVTADLSTRTVGFASAAGTIDTNGNSVTFANAIGNSTSGGLTKVGAGTLTLSGANTYTGATNVNAGALVVNGSIGNGGVNVNNGGAFILNGTTGAGFVNVAGGGTLGGSGTVALSILTSSGSTLAPGSSVGTLTTEGLNIATGTILNWEFNTTPANDKIVVTGVDGLTLNPLTGGAGGGFNLFQEGTVTPFTTAGTYTLMTHAGLLGGAGIAALSPASVLNAQPGFDYSFADIGGQVQLTIALNIAPFTWIADADGNWSEAAKWKDSIIPDAAGVTAHFTSLITAPRVVTLDGSRTVGGLELASAQSYTLAAGTGVLALDNSGSPALIDASNGNHTIGLPVSMTAPGATVNVGASNTLTWTGTIGEAATAPLTKSGAGTLVLSGTNTYTGATNLNGGVTVFSALNNLGAGTAINFNGGRLRWASGNTSDISTRTVTIDTNGGTFDTNGNDVTLTQAIGNSGAGALTKTGAGVLTVSGLSNTFTGGMSVNGGTVVFDGINNLGSAGGIGVAGGALRWAAASTTDISTRTVTIGTGGATLDTNGNGVTFANAIGNGGAGGLTKTGAGALNLAANNTFGGGVIIKSGTVGISADTSLGTVPGAATVNLTVDPGAGSTATLSANANASLVANRNVSLASGTAVFDSQANTLTVGGALSGSAVLRKVGAGTVVLNGAGAIPGGIVISDGSLVLGTAGAGAIGGNGVVTFQGGTLNIGATAPTGNALNVGAGITGNVTGGSGGGLTGIGAVTGSGILNVVGTNVFDLRGDVSAFTGTIILSGTGGIRFNGTNASSSAFFQLDEGLSIRNGLAAVNLGALGGNSGGVLGGAGGGVTQAVTYTIGARNTESTFAGTIQDGANTVSIVKTGNAKLTLSGGNSYTGTTVVNSGTLLVNGAHNGGGPYTINSGGALGGGGTIGTQVNVVSGGIVTPGSSVGTLSIAALSLDGATLNFELDNTGADRIVVEVADVFTLGSNTSTFNLTNLGGLVAGTYTLIDYDGTALTDTGKLVLASPTLGSFNVGLVYNGTNKSIDLSVAVPVQGASWGVDADGSWSVGSNWTGGVAPNGVNYFATFGSVITTGRVVTVDAPQTVGTINFDNAASYTISGSSTITMDVTAGQVGINVTNGIHTIAAPVVLNKDLTISAVGSTGVALTGDLTATGRTITKEGIGTVQFENVRASSLVVSDGTARIRAKTTPNDPAGTSVLSSLSIANFATLDLTNNSAIIDYTGPVGTLVDDVRQHLQSGRLTTSSFVVDTKGLGYADNAVLSPVKTSFGGQSVDASSLLIKYTYFGDVNLDGQVDVGDLGILASNWQTSQVWSGGDFDYNGTVNVNDLGLLASNWQAGVGSPLGPSFAEAAAQLGLPSVAVPEPATMSLLGALASWSLKRPGRRRRA